MVSPRVSYLIHPRKPASPDTRTQHKKRRRKRDREREERKLGCHEGKLDV